MSDVTNNQHSSTSSSIFERVNTSSQMEIRSEQKDDSTVVGSETEKKSQESSTVEPRYNRFSERRKDMFVFIIAVAVFLSPCSSMALLPALSDIAHQFGTTENIITISNGCYVIVMAVSPCVTSPLSDMYGRKITFLFCSFGFTITTILVALSQNLAMFFVFRCITAIFGTAFFSIGGHIVSDIYPPQRRGNAMGWTLFGSQLGPALSPVIAGLIITYVSWRIIFWVLAGVGAFVALLAFFLLQETSETSDWLKMKAEYPDKNFFWIPYNPFSVVTALGYSNLILAGLVSAALLYSSYGMLTPIRNVVDPRFHLTTPIYGSLFYLAPGAGYILGSIFGGKWSDKYVKKYTLIRGKRIAEDRLRSTYIPLGFLLPSTILIFGWSIEKSKGGMALPIIMLFLNGMAQTFCFPSINAYCVDCIPQLKGDAIASNYFLRYIGGAVGTATSLTQIKHIGVGWTCTISSFVLLSGFIVCLVLIQYGTSMRKNHS